MELEGDKSSMEQKCRSNINKYYIFSFILGIHTVRGVYYLFFTVWGQITFFEFMLLQSYFTFMIFILEIPSGAIADSIGRKLALTLSALFVASATFTYSIIPNFFLFMVAETLWALGMALLSGTDEAFLYATLKDSGEEDKLPKILARNRTLRLIALTLSAPVGSVIAELVSLQFTMTCLGFVYIAGFIISLTFTEPPFKNEYHREKYLSIIKTGFKELRNNKILRILFFDRLAIDTLVFVLFWTYQPYLTEIQVPILFFGFITSMMNIINAIFVNILPKLQEKAKNKLQLLILVNIIDGIAFVLLGLTTNIIIGVIFLLIIVGFGYPRYILYVKGINKEVESENRATVLSTINMFGSLVRAILNPIVGIIVMWNVFALFIIIGILIIISTAFTRVKSEYL